MIDAEIRVKTVVDLNAIKKAQAEVEKIQAELDKAKAKAEDLEKVVGGKSDNTDNKQADKDFRETTQGIDKLQKQLDSVQRKLDDLLSGSTETAITDNIEKVVDDSGKMATAEQETAESIKECVDESEKLKIIQEELLKLYRQMDEATTKANKAQAGAGYGNTTSDKKKRIKDISSATYDIEQLQETAKDLEKIIGEIFDEGSPEAKQYLSTLEDMIHVSDEISKTAKKTKDDLSLEVQQEEADKLKKSSIDASSILTTLFGQSGIGKIAGLIKKAGWIGIIIGIVMGILKVFTWFSNVITGIIQGILKLVGKAINSTIALIRLTISYTKEGLQNFIMFGDKYNEVLSDFTATLTQVKNGLAGAFSPIIETVIPYITQLVSWVNVAIEQLSKFLAVLAGRDYYVKANKKAVDLRKQIKGIADDSKNALGSFDKLNIIGQKKDGSEDATAGMFENVSLVGDTSKIVEFANKVKETFKPVIDTIKAWWEGIDWQPLIEAWERFKVAIQPIMDNILPALQKGFLWLWEHVLAPIGTWTLEKGLPTLIDTITIAVEGFKKVWAVLAPKLKEIWERVLEPFMEKFGAWMGTTFIAILREIQARIIKIVDIIIENKDGILLIITILAIAIKVAITLIVGEFERVKNIVKFVVDSAIKDFDFFLTTFTILAHLIKAICDTDISQAFNNIKTVAVRVFNRIIAIIERTINAIIGLVNAIQIDVSDIVGIKGFTVQPFNIPAVTVPRIPELAQGAVIPPNNRFLAMLGDQTSGVNIETPLDTMVQAFNTALAQNSGVSGDIVVNIDGKEVFRAVQKQANSFSRATGRGAFI